MRNTASTSEVSHENQYNGKMMAVFDISGEYFVNNKLVPCQLLIALPDTCIVTERAL